MMPFRAACSFSKRLRALRRPRHDLPRWRLLVAALRLATASLSAPVRAGQMPIIGLGKALLLQHARFGADGLRARSLDPT